jgi:hypothetical protein
MPRERTATGPNGEKYILRDGKWIETSVPTGFVGPTSQMTGSTPSLGYTPEEQGRNASQGWRTGLGTLAANVLSLPHAAGELLAIGGAAPAAIPGGKTFAESLMEEKKKLPASALLAMPDPDAEDVLAVPGAIRKSLSDPFIHRRRLLSTRFKESVAEEEKKAADSPIGATAGRTAADIGTMLAMRPGQRLSEVLKLGPFNPRAEIEGTKGALNYAAKALARGTGRTAEAGFDGAVVATLGDGDPVKTAAWSAGVQAGGSMAMAAKNSFFRNPLKTFAALYLGHEMFKAIAPGPQDLFESKDTAVSEMVAAYGLGTAAALAGGTRGIGSGNVRAITDAFSSASRATIASVVTQLQEAAANKQPQYARVLELLAQDQERFGTDARVRLERAARSDKPRALLNEIDQLMSGTRFRKAFEDADVPSRNPD